MKQKTKNIISWVLSLVMFLSVFTIPTVAAEIPDNADGAIDQLVELLSSNYKYFTDSDKEAIREVRTTMAGIKENDGTWTAIKDNLYTAEVKAIEGLNEEAVKDFLADLGSLYYSEDQEKLKKRAIEFKEHKSTYKALFPDVTLDDVISLLKEIKANPLNYVQYPVPEGFAMPTNLEELETLLQSVDEMKLLVKRPIKDNAIKTALLNLGWNEAVLTKAYTNIASQVDPNGKARIASGKATLRAVLDSKAKLVGASTTIKENETVNYELKLDTGITIDNAEITKNINKYGIISVGSSNENIVAVKDGDKVKVTAKSKGTADLLFYITGDTPEEAIKKVTITVESASGSTDTGSTSGTTPSTPVVTPVEPELDDKQPTDIPAADEEVVNAIEAGKKAALEAEVALQKATSADVQKAIAKGESALKQIAQAIPNATSDEVVKYGVNQLGVSAERLVLASKDIKTATAIIDILAKEVNVLLQNPAIKGYAMKDLKADTAFVASRALEKAGTVTISTKVNKDKAIATITKTADVEAVLSEIKQGANELDKILRPLGIKVARKVTLKVDVAQNVAKVETKVPADVFQKAEKVVQSMDFVFPFAKINFPVDAIKNIDDGKEFSLQVERKDTGNSFILSAMLDGEKITQFEKMLMIQLAHTLRKSQNLDHVTVVYAPAFQNMGATVGQKVARFETDHFSTYVIADNAKTFIDVPSNHWVAPYVTSMAAKGVISGVTENQFAPSVNVTRAEFAKLIVETLGLPLEDKVTFADVKPEDWFYSYVGAAAKAGIVVGDGAKFNPNASITREDMAVMLGRAIIHQGGTLKDAAAKIDLSMYVDGAEVADYAKQSVAAMTSYLFMEGKGNGEMDPKGNARREEAAKVIYMLFNY